MKLMNIVMIGIIALILVGSYIVIADEKPINEEFTCESDNDCKLKEYQYCCGSRKESAQGCYHKSETVPGVDCGQLSPCPTISAVNKCKCEDSVCVGSFDSETEPGEDEQPTGPGPTSCNEEHEVWDAELEICVIASEPEQQEEEIPAETETETIKNKIREKKKLKVALSNGRNAEIKVMPETASERALERLRIKVCSEENSCVIQLKEVGKANEARLAYEVQAERHAKILWIFRAKMLVKSEVDAETGAIISVKKPWWAFLAAEPEE